MLRGEGGWINGGDGDHGRVEVAVCGFGAIEAGVAADDCAGTGEGGHAIHEPDCEGRTKGDFGWEMG